jgi:hypothetical protein
MILVGESKLEAPKKTFEFALRIWLAVRWAYSPSLVESLFASPAYKFGMVTSDRLSRFAFQASQNLHVASEAGRTIGQMFADFCVAGLHGTFSHALEVGIWGATNTLTVGKGF